MSRTISGLRRKRGFSLQRPQWKMASACHEGRISCFFSIAPVFLMSYDGDLRDPLVGPQGGPVSTRPPWGPSGFLCSRCRGPGPHLVLRLETQGSSPEPTWISDSSGGVHGGLRASSHGEPCKSPLLSTQKSSFTLPVLFTIGIGGFLSMGHRAVTPAIVF